MSESTLHPAHPEVELIAEHAEGLLPAEQADELDAHLRDCADCRATHAALLELTELLAAEPDPGPMPADVAARIDAALATEAARPAESADTEPQPQPEAGAKAGSGGARTAGGGRSAAETRPGDKRPAGRPGTRLRLRRIATGLALCLAAAGIGLAVSSGGDIDSGGSAASSAANGAAAVPQNSGALSRAPGYEFTDGNVPAQIQQLIRNSDKALAAAGASASATQPFSQSLSPSPSPTGGNPSVAAGGREGQNTAGIAPAAAPSCVLAATGRQDLPQIQELGRYHGVEAYALIYPDQTDPAHRWDVFLIQNSCTDPLVMFHQSLPRT